MNKHLIMLVFIVLLSAAVFAVPVSYVVELTDQDNYTIKAISDTGTTETNVVSGTSGLINHLANYGELVEFYVNGEILRRIDQPLPGSVTNILVVTNGSDLNKDGIAPDPYPSGTGLLGDENYIHTNLPKVGLVNSSDHANITSNGNVIIEFDFTTVNMSEVEIWMQDDGSPGSLVVTGLNIVGKKTIYIDRLDAGSSSVCVKDAPVTSVSQISSLCIGADEHALICNGVSVDGYTCSIVDSGSKYKISGLTHSAVQEQAVCGDGIVQTGEACDGSNLNGNTCTSLGFDGGTVSCTSSCTISTAACTRNTGGGGGGGGGSICLANWQCQEWGPCQEAGLQDCQEWTDANNCGYTYVGGNFRECEYNGPEETDEPEPTTEVINATEPEQNQQQEQAEEQNRGNLFTGNVVGAVRNVVGDTLNFFRGNKLKISGLVFTVAVLTASFIFTFTRGGRRSFRRIKRKLDKYYSEFE